MGDTKIYAKDTVNIDNVDNLAEILKADVAIGEKDVKISYNKICYKKIKKRNRMIVSFFN